MPKFTILYKSPTSAIENSAPPEDAEEGMKPWKEWAEKCGDKLVDMGTPLESKKVITKGNGSESDLQITGWAIMQGDSLEDILPLLENHHFLEWDDSCEIEVLEQLPM